MEIKNEKINNHPNGLPTLFLTEMWERLSYYGMRSLLVLYLVKELHFSDADAGQVYGLYTSLVYLTPILGGYLADRYLGYKRSIYIGSFLMLLGHVSLAMPQVEFFYSGLVLLILGNGFFKPNMSTLVGRLYDEKTALRDSGYTIFYMGINLGGLIGPIICGSLGERVDWHYGFAAAGVGMAIGMIVFYFGSRKLPDRIWESSQERSVREELSSGNFRHRILLIVVLSIFSIFFWMAFEQMGSSMTLFADRYTDRHVGSWEVPASFFQSINPLLILCMGPFIALLWQKLAKISFDPDPILKFAFSLFILGIGFYVMVWASKTRNGVGLVSIWFLLGAYFWNTLAELLLSPVGLSFVNRTAPAQYAGLLMGLWFLSNAIGHYLAGFASGYLNQFGELSDFFYFFVLSSWGASLLLFIFWFRLKKWLT